MFRNPVTWSQPPHDYLLMKKEFDNDPGHDATQLLLGRFIQLGHLQLCQLELIQKSNQDKGHCMTELVNS